MKLTNDELRKLLYETDVEDYYGEDMPDPDQYDEESKEYREERERLEEWADEFGIF